MPPDSTSNTELPIEVGSEAVSIPRGSRGSIEISHGSVGLESWVIIKIPVPAFESQDEAQRRAEILERARKLVDHACKTGAAHPRHEPKFVWLPTPTEPASREALDASFSAVEGMRWTMVAQPIQETGKKPTMGGSNDTAPVIPSPGIAGQQNE